MKNPTRKITNVHIIANYIHKNPGCRRTDILRHLYIARTGKEPLRGYHNRVCSQYFQSYGSASNVYLNRLWYNRFGKVHPVTKSSYMLSVGGLEYVLPQHEMIRPFKNGDFIEWQFDSPRRHGWHQDENVDSRLGHFTKAKQLGLVIDCNDTYGLWALSLDGNQRYISHHAYVRLVGE